MRALATITTLGFSIFSRYNGDGITRARRDLDNYNQSVAKSEQKLNSWSGRILLVAKGIAAFGPALVPLGASILSVAGATAALGTTAAASLGAYGAAMKGAIAQALALDKAHKAMTPTQKAFVTSVHGMQSAWKQFIAATSDKTLATATNVVQGLTAGIGRLKPLVDAVHPSILRVSQDFENWMKSSDGLQRYVSLIKDAAGPALDSLIQAGKNVINVLGDGFRAFLPHAQGVADALLHGSEALKSWSDSGGFQRFLAYVQSNSGLVRDFFDALGAALKTLAVSFKDLGPTSLILTTTILRLVAMLPPSWITAIVQGFVAWKVAMTGLMIIQTVIALVNALKIAWFTLNLAFSASAIGLVILAVIALVAAIVLLIKNWDTVSAALKVAWEATWNALKTAALATWSALQVAWSATVSGLSTAWTAVSGALVAAWNATWNGLVVAAQAVWGALTVAWSATVSGLATAWTAVSGALVAAWNAVWSGLGTAAQAVWSALTAAWGAFVNGLAAVWTAVSSALTAAWNAVWNGLLVVAQAIWAGLTAAWSAVVTGFATVWTTVSAALTAAWNAVWAGLQAAAQAVWSAMQAAWSAVVTGFSTIWSTVSAALTAAWNTVWNALKVSAQAVWTAMQAAWSAVVTAFSTIWSSVSSALSSAWNAFWNALKATGQAVWTAMQAAWSAFLNAVRSLWNTVSSGLQSAWNTFWNALKTSSRAVWDAMHDAWNAFLNAVRTLWNTFSAALTTAWNTFWNLLKTSSRAIWDAMHDAWFAFLNAIRTLFTTAAAALKAAWDAAWNAMKTSARAVWDAMHDAWNSFLNAIKALWSAAGSALKSAWSSVWNSMRDTAKSLWHNIGGVIEKAINGIIDIINKVGDGINGIASKVGLGDIFGNIGHVGINFAVGGVVGDVPHFSAGGTVNFSGGGGVLGGFAPGRDTVPAMLSKGESVLTPEATRALGGKFVHWANSHFSRGRGGRRVQGGAGMRKQISGIPHFAGGGVMAWHRDSPKGWGFADGGPVFPTPGGGAPAGNLGSSGLGAGSSNAPNDKNILTGDDGGGGGILDKIGGAIKDVIGSISGLGGIGGLVLGFIGKEAIEKLFSPLLDMVSGFNMGGEFGKILVAAAKKLVEGAMEWMIKKDEEAKKEYMAKAVAGAQSVSAWAPLAAQALAMAGLSPSQLPNFLALMAAESGGNPNAINNWDSNAAAGIPSQGLMQVIPPTFAAYHVAGTSNNILDPLANMAASANYIKHVYGGIVPGSPYAVGTTGATAGWHLVGEQGPELVKFRGGESVSNNMDTRNMFGKGGGDVHIDMPINVQGNLDQAAVDRLDSEVLPKLRVLLHKGTGTRH